VDRAATVRPNSSHVARRAARLAGLFVFILSLQAITAAAGPASSLFELLQGANPLAGKRLYVDPNSEARRQAETLRRSRPQDAALIDRIASQPNARWLGDWVRDIRKEVEAAVSTITGSGALPIFVAYNIPGRDCGLYSAGGAGGSNAYRAWIRSFAAGIRGRQSIVILEPDALAGMDCLKGTGQQDRVALLSDAVTVLKSQRASVYIDAGHARWQSAEEMARRLKLANIAAADGFSLNVSNYITNAANIAYGERLSRLVGGKHFIIDTSRNGIGAETDWCNPRGQALGMVPTTRTGHPLVDAFLWVKQPGESDGTCRGGPRAGTWWNEIALELSRAATTLGRTLGR
jgi:endoglucanase